MVKKPGVSSLRDTIHRLDKANFNNGQLGSRTGNNFYPSN